MPSPRKPIILINHLVEPPGRITGISRYAFGLLGAWIRRDEARFVLATTFARQDLPTDIAAGVEDVITLPHVASTPLNYLRMRRELPKLAKQAKADVIYAMNPMCPAVPGIPGVLTVHDLYYEVLSEHYAWRHRLWWKLFFGDAARGSQRIACVSANTAKDAARFHPGLAGKTCVVSGAAVLPHFPQPQLRAAATEPYILLIGNITPNKNVGFLIEALKLLQAQGRPVRALHAGRDLTGDLARAMAGGGAQVLQSVGGTSDQELDALLGNACALVQPSIYEGFGLPIIEAQERGVPVIASDIAVFREVMGQGGMLIPLGDVPALANAIHTMVTDTDRQAQLAGQALSNAQRFSWANSAEAAQAIVTELVR